VSGIILAVESGGGAALVPSCIACLVGSRLKLIPISTEVPEVSVIIAWKKPAPAGPAAQFLAITRTVASPK
jgi:DNA-binding transcriptional LysR family regulator